jgi:acetoin utilization deacetylase AcuC-like enzyme
MKIITDERCLAYEAPGHPERPARISATVEGLRRQTKLPVEWETPANVDESSLLRAHSPELISRLQQRGDFDSDTPWHPDIAAHARRSVGAALAALKSARAGQPAFSLMRPPGHHATRNRIMGFCYLNSVAIAALEALATGIKRVAVFDFDVHHGNGTEDILLDRPGAAFFSIHQYPCYPGTGAEDAGHNCFNYPVPPGFPREKYRRVLADALGRLQRYQPELVIISAGFDSYARDPLAEETLEADDFHWLGESIRKLGVPSFSVLEGGYSDDLPGLILEYLLGLNGG